MGLIIVPFYIRLSAPRSDTSPATISARGFYATTKLLPVTDSPLTTSTARSASTASTRYRFLCITFMLRYIILPYTRRSYEMLHYALGPPGWIGRPLMSRLLSMPPLRCLSTAPPLCWFTRHPPPPLPLRLPQPPPGRAFMSFCVRTCLLACLPLCPFLGFILMVVLSFLFCP